MNIKDPNGFALRQSVARQTRKFYAEWTAQLAAGTSDIWRLVEYRLAVKKEAEGVPYVGNLPRASTQQQPMQQQQTKASPKKT
jgi:hypothetical protein